MFVLCTWIEHRHFVVSFLSTFFFLSFDTVAVCLFGLVLSQVMPMTACNSMCDRSDTHLWAFQYVRYVDYLMDYGMGRFWKWCFDWYALLIVLFFLFAYRHDIARFCMVMDLSANAIPDLIHNLVFEIENGRLISFCFVWFRYWFSQIWYLFLVRVTFFVVKPALR